MTTRKSTSRRRRPATKRATTSWVDPSLTWAGTRLAFDAQQVIAMRMLKLAAGGAAAQREAVMMVNEKVKAMADSQTAFLKAVSTGKSDKAPKRAVSVYQRRVSANKRRLRKG